MAETWTPAPSALTGPSARDAVQPARPVLRTLRESGHEAFLVGGGVRDLLLGRPVGDWDVATSAEPDEVMVLWPKAVPTGIRHGTVTLPGGQGQVEITTYRSEGPYGDGRRPDWVRFGAGLEADLTRRDFTVNAIAFDPETGRIFDPWHGADDLARRMLRAVGDPDRRFAEDALRPLRGIRFAAVLEFEIEPATWDGLVRAAPRVAGVARERVRTELMKMLEAPRPSRGIELMRRSGMLQAVLPELLEGRGVSQNRYHEHDVYWHTLYALDAAPRDRPLVRLAVLLHDIGKPRTRTEVDGEGKFYGHQNVGAEMTRDILDRLRFSRDDRDHVVRLVREHMFHYTPEWSEGAVRRFLRRVGPETVGDLFALRRADDRGRGGEVEPGSGLEELGLRIDRVLAREEALTVHDLAVSGRDVMETLGLEPGPDVGRILRALLEQVLENPGLNDRDTLLDLARKSESS